MINKAVNSNESAVYPGLYTPVAEMETLLNAVKKDNHSENPGAMAKINKSADTLLIEMALPGFNRQNIFISGYKSLLSVIVLPDCNTETAEDTVGQKKRHDPMFVKNLLIPENADGLFGSAEYKNGYLTICIPTGRVSTDVPANYRIMVY